MINELAVPSPTSFLLPSVQALPSLCTPSAHHNRTSGYLPGTTSNLGGGGGGGGGGNGGGGLHWQTSWQLSVTSSATGLEHDFWGSPWVICEETSQKEWKLIFHECASWTWAPEWHLIPWWELSSCHHLLFTEATTRSLFPMWSQFYFIFYLT